MTSYYNHLYNNQKKIPGVVVIVTLAVLITGLTAFFSIKSTNQQVTLKENLSVQRVDIGNVKDKSFSVFWRTEEPTKGYIVYGDNPQKLDKYAFDDKDKTSDPQERNNHLVSIRNLTPNSETYFYLVVDDEFTGQSESTSFVGNTLGLISTPYETEPIYGQIKEISGESVNNAIAILRVGNSKPLVVRTNSQGTYLFSLCCLYDAITNEQIYPNNDDEINVEMISDDGNIDNYNSTVQVLVATDEIIFGGNSKKIASINDTEAEDISEVLAAADTIEKFESIDIIYPKEGAVIPASRPIVKGVGEPGNKVKGKFPTQNRIFQVEIDQNRNWIYSPSFDFKPGDHVLNVTTLDNDGSQVELTRTFVILKSGEAVLSEATESATITPTTEPTLSPTTAEPSTAPTSMTTLTPPPPVTGFDPIPIALLSLVLIVIGGGVILLF